MIECEVTGYLEDVDGARIPFDLKIFQARRTEGECSYYCAVHAPALFQRDMRIFGVDKKQARELAIYVVLQLIGNKRIVDENGNIITIS